MRTLLASLFVLAGCGSSHSGVCNVCPGFSSVDGDACAEQGAAKKCASAVFKEVTDDSCGVGQEPFAHMACVYEDCEESLDCDAIGRL